MIPHPCYSSMEYTYSNNYFYFFRFADSYKRNHNKVCPGRLIVFSSLSQNGGIAAWSSVIKDSLPCNVNLTWGKRIYVIWTEFSRFGHLRGLNLTKMWKCLRNKCNQQEKRLCLQALKEERFVCLGFIVQQEFFTHFEMSSLPVNGCKFLRMHGTYDHWRVRVL